MTDEEKKAAKVAEAASQAAAKERAAAEAAEKALGAGGTAGKKQGGEPKTVQVIEVAGPAQGRWRARRHWGREATAVPLSAFTPAQIEAIQDDPMLVSVIRDAPG